MAGGSDIVVVLRHALAGRKLVDPKADFERGLDPQGVASAAGLPDVLLDHVLPAELVSSPYLRCTETVLPLAERLELPIVIADELGPSAPAHRLEELLLRVGHRTVVCTHGEPITRLFVDLTCEKGAFWIVRREGETLRPERYVSPPLPIGVAGLVGVGAL